MAQVMIKEKVSPERFGHILNMLEKGCTIKLESLLSNSIDFEDKDGFVCERKFQLVNTALKFKGDILQIFIPDYTDLAERLIDADHADEAIRFLLKVRQ